MWIWVAEGSCGGYGLSAELIREKQRSDRRTILFESLCGLASFAGVRAPSMDFLTACWVGHAHES